MKRLALLIGLSAAATFVGCGVAPENVDDQATGEAEQAASSAAPVRAGGEYLIATRPDYRKCAYPMCGGWFVRRVNHLLTRCTDGSFQNECHATELDLSDLCLTDEVAGKFRDCLGVVWGECAECGPGPWKPSTSSPFTLGETIDNILGRLEVPVLAGLTIGHTSDQATLPLGVMATLDATQGQLTIEEAATLPPLAQ